jgi:acetyl-CoA carboxylase biotin carboxyl carrier protein
MKTVSSPLVGVFYAAPAPTEAPFVQVGDVVKKGDVLCLVEAMKVMNEITAECAGQIVDIAVQNGDVVEFGQTLFKLV